MQAMRCILELVLPDMKPFHQTVDGSLACRHVSSISVIVLVSCTEKVVLGIHVIPPCGFAHKWCLLPRQKLCLVCRQFHCFLFWVLVVYLCNLFHPGFMLRLDTLLVMYSEDRGKKIGTKWQHQRKPRRSRSQLYCSYPKSSCWRWELIQKENNKYPT